MEMLEKMTLSGDGDSAYGVNAEYDELLTSIDLRAPDWRAVRRNVEALWLKTRDLRVAAYFALAGLALEGLGGFADGVALIRWLVAEHWEGFYPRLDPDDGNDPTERINILAMISPAPDAYDDPVKFVQLFRAQRLVPEGPKYTLRDLMIAEGELDAGEEKVDQALLTAEFTAVPLAVIAARAATVEAITADLSAIADAITDKTGGRYSVSFTTLLGELKILRRFYARFNHDAGDGAADGGTPALPAGNKDSKRTTANDAADSSKPPYQGEPNGRAEALALLKKGCDYFKKHEPTSPVPYLVERALRMADMNFLDLLAEVDPSGVDRGRDILGVKGE